MSITKNSVVAMLSLWIAASRAEICDSVASRLRINGAICKVRKKNYLKIFKQNKKNICISPTTLRVASAIENN